MVVPRRTTWIFRMGAAELPHGRTRTFRAGGRGSSAQTSTNLPEIRENFCLSILPAICKNFWIVKILRCTVFQLLQLLLNLVILPSVSVTLVYNDERLIIVLLLHAHKDLAAELDVV